MLWWLKLLLFFLQGSFLFKICQGYIECDCSTEECRVQGQELCRANNYCYVEAFGGIVTRGCIDERTPLLCENRPPEKNQKNKNWPVLYCCKNEDFCNSVKMPSEEEETEPEEEEEVPIPETELVDTVPPVVSCPDNLNKEDNDSSNIFNPIYIAVPVAGVCVLLALIIFAMYLLRRRNDYYDTYHYHENATTIPQKHCDGKLANGKINRCTDSERSSQGSETKLFLQEHV
ncbi:hypothetical protein ScPMuIL_015437 [Solemya velum]